MQEDSIYIGEWPCDEEPVSLGDSGRFYAIVYKKQLKRLFPNGDFRIKKNPHDFGPYYTVEAYFSADSEYGPCDRHDAAFEAEGNSPEKWDQEASMEIAQKFRDQEILRKTNNWQSPY